MTLQDLRNLLKDFEGADGDINILMRSPKDGLIIDFDAVASIRWVGMSNSFTEAGKGEKVFFLDVV